MTEAPLPNDPASRSATGEILPPATTGTETKPAEALASPPVDPKAPEAKPGETLLTDKKDAPAGAPEKYEDFKVPEGYTLNGDDAKAATELFKEMNLNQDQAQKLVDFYSEKFVSAAKAPFNAYQNMRKEWQDAAKADPDIGSKLPQVKATVAKAIDALGDTGLAKDFREAMDLTGAGDHPAFIKTIYKLASLVAEGSLVTGGNPSPHGQTAPGKPVSAAKAMYPNLP